MTSSAPTTSTAVSPTTTFVAQIEERQAALGITDHQLCEALGFEREITLSLIMQGTMRLPLPKIPALATALGLDPVFGINHVVRERCAALAYDLMEPFRPCVDARVLSWVQRFPHGDPAEGAPSAFEVSKEYRVWVTSFTVERVGHLDLELDVRGVIEGVCRSFRRAVMAKRSGIYKPWTPNDSKWAGSLSPLTFPS